MSLIASLHTKELLTGSEEENFMINYHGVGFNIGHTSFYCVTS